MDKLLRCEACAHSIGDHTSSGCAAGIGIERNRRCACVKTPPQILEEAIADVYHSWHAAAES